jgi:uncharacterized phage-like protein YoqJ
MSNGRNTTLCFSGHRYYVSAPDDEARLAAALEAAFEDGYRTFISGMAPGFDLAAGEAAVRLRSLHTEVALVAAIPFAGQPAGYSTADRARYDALLAAADEVRVLAERYSHGCYLRRDDWMVGRSGRIICWYDGAGGRGGSRLVSPRASKTGSGTGSGTRYTVRRALAQGLEIVNLFRAPATLF